MSAPVDDVPALMRRYRVTTLEALVEAQARHIKQLQDDMREEQRDAQWAVRDARAEGFREGKADDW